MGRVIAAEIPDAKKSANGFTNGHYPNLVKKPYLK